MFAFAGTGWENVKIADSVTKIDMYAFYGCYKLAKITISKGVTEIRGAAFVSTALTEVTIPSNVKVIEDQAFSYCNNLISVKFMLNAETIEDLQNYNNSLFNNCSQHINVYVSYKSIDFYSIWLSNNDKITVNVSNGGIND